MGRSLPEKPIAETPEREPPELAFLDARIASLLDAIKGEESPPRLLDLAAELQSELAVRRQRRRPN